MMTKNSSYSRIVAVWLVLLAFLCGMIVPSLALANQEMEIEMEGDPGDGMDFAGGGGGLSGGDDNQAPNGFEPGKKTSTPFSFVWYVGVDNIWFNNQFVVPIWTNGQLQFVVIYTNKEWGAIR